MQIWTKISTAKINAAQINVTYIIDFRLNIEKVSLYYSEILTIRKVSILSEVVSELNCLAW